MDSSLIKVLIQLGTYGPLGIMSVLFFILFLMERKRTEAEREKVDALATKLHEVSMASIKADVEHSKAYEPMERIFDAAIRMLSEKRDEPNR